MRQIPVLFLLTCFFPLASDSFLSLFLFIILFLLHQYSSKSVYNLNVCPVSCLETRSVA